MAKQFDDRMITRGENNQRLVGSFIRGGVKPERPSAF